MRRKCFSLLRKNSSFEMYLGFTTLMSCEVAAVWSKRSQKNLYIHMIPCKLIGSVWTKIFRLIFIKIKVCRRYEKKSRNEFEVTRETKTTEKGIRIQQRLGYFEEKWRKYGKMAEIWKYGNESKKNETLQGITT